jgi:aspartyl/glutamyl-tRNA(Asn/Gln) amidotransferase C subunit
MMEHYAALAKLKLTKEDSEGINALLKIADGIHDIAVRPVAAADTGTAPLRDDIPGPSLPRELVLRGAPEVEAGCVSVPKIRGGEG